MFEITSADIALLNDADLRSLVGQLCEAEMRKRGLPTSAVTWGGHQDSSDGGLDTHVALLSTTEIHGWVARPQTGFQVKKQKMPRSEILAEMRPAGALRPAIRELADRSGAYIIISSQDSTSHTSLRNRLQAMADAVSDLANAKALTLDFYDGGRLATWVRDHPGLVPWVRERIGKPVQGWRSYGPWADISGDVSGEYLLDDRLRIHTAAMESPDGFPALAGIGQIRDLLRQPGTVARLVGLSGVGKTRFTEALFDQGVGFGNLNPSLAFYANVAAESPAPHPTDLVSQLIAGGYRAILVVDNCPSDLHRRLSQACRSAGSTVSIITIEYDIRDDLPEGTEVFRLDTSSPELIEKLVRRRFKEVSPTDAATIAKFSDGNARVAIALAATVEKNESIGGLRDEELVERLIFQRHPPDPSLLAAAQACSLVYSFDVRVDGADLELGRLGGLIGESAQKMYGHVSDLLDRGSAQRRGDWRAILPHAIANRLAAAALRRIPLSVIKAHLVDGAPERLLRSFSRRLGYLDTSTEAVAIVRGWLGVGGILDEVAEHGDTQRAMLQYVAPTAPGAALSTLERGLLAASDSATLLKGREYVHVIRSLAYDADLFPRCAALLGKIAAAGDLDGRSNRALEAFTSLFQLVFSGTHAPIEQRLAVIQPLLVSDKAEQRTLGLKSLDVALEAWQFQPFHDFEFGGRSRSYGYWPRSPADVKHWFELTLSLSAAVACSDSPIASQVRVAVAGQLRGIWTRAATYDEIEDACRTISEAQFWPEGWIAVRQIQHYDSKGFTPEVASRLASLEALLRPRDLVQKVRSVVLSNDFSGIYVTDIEHDGTNDVGAAAQNLGSLVAADDRAFDELLPDLVSHSWNVWSFGRGLAQGSCNPRATWRRLVSGIAAAPEQQRGILVLCGFLQALHEANHETAEAILDHALEDRVEAPWLPALQSAAGIDHRGVERLLHSLSLGLTPIQSYRALHGGRATDTIPADQLRDFVLGLASNPAGLDVAIEILDTRLHRNEANKQPHEREIVEAGCALIRQAPLAKERDDMLDYRLGMISRACLRGEQGAPAVADVLRRMKEAVAKYEAYAFYFDDFIGGLFAAQPTPALEALCGGGKRELEAGVRILHDLQKNPLDSMAESDLFAWCDREPTSRYPAVAAAITIRHDKEGEAPQWTRRSLYLLDKAPDRGAVLKKYIAQIDSMSWHVSAEARTANLKFLDALRLHSDPAVVDFVAQESARLVKISDDRLRAEREADSRKEQSFE